MHDKTPKPLDPSEAPILVAIMIAARRTGNRLLEQVARDELETKHRVKLRFLRDSPLNVRFKNDGGTP